jgi:DNA adenine methylase
VLTLEPVVVMPETHRAVIAARGTAASRDCRRALCARATDSQRARPLVKWAGGKGALLGELQSRLPAGMERMRYVEPFAGGAALFFAQRPREALLGDINAQLIAVYRVVQQAVDELVWRLVMLERSHDVQQFYEVRERYNATEGEFESVERAAQFIYLNKTCFNGLHRVNRHGHFNVPMGRYTAPRIADAERLHAASLVLQGVTLRTGSFETVLDTARAGDFVYLDPPYAPLNRTSSFTMYTKQGFAERQQRVLCDVFAQLDRRGCALLLSHSATAAIRRSYSAYRIDEVLAPRSINAAATRRARVSELIVRNY